MQRGSQAVASSNGERPTATAVKKLLTESVAASEAAWRRELRALEGRQGEAAGKLEAAAGAAKAAGAHAESLGQQLVSNCVLCAVCACCGCGCQRPSLRSVFSGLRSSQPHATAGRTACMP